MEKFIGVKELLAGRMSRQEYVDYRGWILPVDEDGADEGYLVEYLDGGKPNHPAHEGYISWSPEEVFNNAYRRTTGMPLAMLLKRLRWARRLLVQDGMARICLLFRWNL
jgi:hypothetical protein